MVKKLLILLVLVGILISGCDILRTDVEIIETDEDIKEINFSCVSNNECDWMITNCCPEMSGAIWECVNKVKSRRICPEGKYGCEDEEKLKPSEPCNCIDNKCQAKEIEQVEEEKNEEALLKGDYGIELKNMTIPLGESFDISLSCNPTTGFDFLIKEIDNMFLKLISLDYESSSDEPCTGCGGTCYYTFQPLKTGTTNLKFYYCQPWQCEESLVRIVKFNVTIENKTTLTKKGNKVWVSIDPHQCGDYRVPNSIYFDYPNGVFPEYNTSPSFPMSFIVKENMLELFSVEGLFSVEPESMYESIVNLSKENNNDFFDKYAETEIIIYDYKKIDRNIVTCAACSCSAGYDLFLLISEFDVPKLQKIGYGVSGEPIIEAEKYCNKDEDCVKARGDCCGCNSGGTATAINKDFYAEYEESLEICACVAMASTDISCFAKPICLNHQCDLDYKDYTVCEEAYDKDWCYWQFAIINNDTSLCEKISHDEPNVKPSINKCKKEIQK